MMKGRIKQLVALLWICICIYIIINFNKHPSVVYLENEESIAYDETDDASKKELIKMLQSSIRSQYLSCHCKQVSLPTGILQNYEQHFAKKMDWLNLTTMEHLAKHHPNYPTSIMPSLFKSRCHLIPPPHNITWSNYYWQEAYGEKTSFLLYSAIIDNRPLTDKRPIVRIIAYTKIVDSTVPWCYLWFNASGPPVVSSSRLKLLVSNQDPFNLECQVPPEEAHRKPLAVSVVENPCMPADNLLEVIGSLERNSATAYRKGKRPLDDDGTGYSVAVCGTGLYYYHEDFSFRLVEWLEILRVIGISKVFLYETDVHPNIRKVLQFYEKDGLIGVTKFSYFVPAQNEPSLRWLSYKTDRKVEIGSSLVFFRDCILRHMHEYRFITHVDLDEIPMMLQHDSYVSWMDDTLKRVFAKSTTQKMMPASYEFTMRFHFDNLPISETNKELPKYLSNLRHSNSQLKQGSTVKSLYDMNTVIDVASHRAKTRNSGRKINAYSVPPSEAYVGHYKYNSKNRNAEMMEENYLLQYKDQIEKAVTKVLKELKLI